MGKILKHVQHTFLDYPSKEDGALSIYFVGCIHSCLHCQNTELQDPQYNIDVMNITASKLLNYVYPLSKKYRTNKLVFIGGDPLHSQNEEDVWDFCLRYGNIFDICIYTGKEIIPSLLKGYTYIKTGRYIDNLKQNSYKDDTKFVLASKNQKLYDKNYTLISTNGIYYFKD